MCVDRTEESVCVWSIKRKSVCVWSIKRERERARARARARERERERERERVVKQKRVNHKARHPQMRKD